MLIIAGWLEVPTEARDRYLADHRSVVAGARAAEGCLDFCLAADPLEPSRIQVFERWHSAEELEDFRGTGPDADIATTILDADVRRYHVTDVGPP